MVQLTLKEVLARAITREIESQQLYTELSQKVNHGAAKEAFIELGHQEQGHQKLLERYQRGDIREGALSREQVLDYKITEKLDQPEAGRDMKLPDVFLMAANREKAAHEFYLGLAGIHPAGEIKRLLEDMAIQELGHKHSIEFLYTEVGFPQTDGG